MCNIKNLIINEGYTPQKWEDKNGHLNNGAIRLPGCPRPGDIAKT